MKNKYNTRKPSESEAIVRDELRGMARAFAVLNGLVILGSIAAVFAGGSPAALIVGLIAGNVISIANFYVMGLIAGNALGTKRAQKAQNAVNIGYGARYIAIFLICALLLGFRIAHPITLLLPLFFPKIYYIYTAIFDKNNTR